MNTILDLARATTKSKSKMQAVSNGHVGLKRKRWRIRGASQRRRPRRCEQDRGKGNPQSNVQGEEDL